MEHRHLNHQRLTLAAIDDIIARGGMSDWVVLRQALRHDRSIRDRVVRVCQQHVGDPYAQRYHFWMHYAQSRAA